MRSKRYLRSSSCLSLLARYRTVAFGAAICLLVVTLMSVAMPPTPADAIVTPPCPSTPEHRYLAEGSTKFGFDEWILLANPDTSSTATACLTFMTSGGPVNGGTVSIAPRSRKSVHVNSKVTSSQVAADVAVISGTVEAERSMSNSTPGLAGAHVGQSSRTPGFDWFMAEGVTAGGSETWVLVGNPSPTETASVDVTFMTGGGGVAGPTFALAPQSRKSVRAGAYVTSFDVSSKVHATGAPVVAERATYLAHSGLRGSTDSPAVSAPSLSSTLAEGATAGGFETWVLVANPDPTLTAVANLTYLTGTGPVVGPVISLPPNSRRSVRVRDTVTSFDVSTRVDSDRPVVVERAMYSSSGSGPGGATGEGLTATSPRWLAVEGATAGGFETWVLVANPDAAETSTVAVSYLTNGGPVTGPTISIPPLSRRSVRANNTLTAYDVASAVDVLSGPEVFVDRTVYTPAGPAHDMTSGPAIPVSGGPAGGDAPTIVAAGDIACAPYSAYFNGGLGAGLDCRQMATSDLAISENATAVLALGDLQYEAGEATSFAASYDPSWGRLKAITHPAVGNHEYVVPGAAPYYAYFGAAAGASGWYSYDLGSWHLIALNSNCGAIGGCGAGSPQELWLRADLAAHPAACTLAYWHHPRFSSGGHGDDPSTDALWRDLYGAGADVVLNGHDHDYERFAPQTPDAVSDTSNGIREFVVGTGGKNLTGIGAPRANSEFRASDSLGILKMTLHESGYEWEFKAAVGPSSDSGLAPCH